VGQHDERDHEQYVAGRASPVTDCLARHHRAGLLFGFPLAWLLARGQFRGKALLRGLTTLPMVLPPVVGGIALLLAYGRKGMIGEPLNAVLGISLPFTLPGVIVAEAFVAMPFFVITLAALDVSIKTDVRRHLRSVLRATHAANVLVTHDLLDAVGLADRIVVIEDGGIVQSGTPRRGDRAPAVRVRGRPGGGQPAARTGSGAPVDLDEGGHLAIGSEASGPVLAVVAPSAVSVHRQRPQKWAANVWRGQIGAVDLLGDRVRVRVDGTPVLTAEVPPSAVDELKLDAAAVTVYPP
jgi:hypothetical protein